MTLPLNFLPNYASSCTFSSLQVPKRIQPPTCFPPSPPHIFPLLFLEMVNPHYPQPLLATFITSCFKEVCLAATCSAAFLRKSSSVCLSLPFLLLVSYIFLPLTETSATWIYYSTPYWFQSPAKHFLIHNRVLNILTPGSQISSDHTLIILFFVTTFFSYQVPCPPIQPI